jgi:hypothetical protein
MKDNLKDLIDHTHGLDGIDTVKIVGTDIETTLNAVADDKSVIINGTFKNPIADFIGTFGMPNLSKLKIIVGFDTYDDDATISVSRGSGGDASIPVGIHFETKTKDFINDYRFMSKALAEEKVRGVSFRGATWNVTFEPSVVNILRLKKQAQANSEEVNCVIKVENGDLKMYFGDPSTHSGNFVFHSGVTGSLTRAWMYPVKQIMAILDLVGDKTMRIADAGALEISIDSGIAVYSYLLPAQAK